MTRLKWAAVIGLLVYFAGLLLAVTKEKKNQNVLDYFFAGRSLPFWALSITFVASWWGAGSAISTADLAYSDGLGAFWYYGVPVLLSTLLMMVNARGIRRVGYLTQGRMMEARYSASAARLLSVMVLVFMIFTAASQMVGIGSFFGTYLGLRYETAVLIGTGIVLIYSMFGGFRGVVLTDIIQFVLLLLSAVAVFGAAMIHSGGFSAISAAAQAQGKTDFLRFGAGASKYMTYVITFGCAWMIQANVWQRISAAKTDRDARNMTVMSFFAYIPLYLIVVLTGMAGIVLFDRLPEGGVVTSIVMDYMPPLLGGVVFVGISAAIMSTMDSLINTGAMTIVMDLSPRADNDAKKLRLSQIATLLVTAAALLIALRIRSILEISWIASDIITTGVFIPLVIGFVWRRGNARGAMASMLWGLLYCGYNLLIQLGVKLPALWEPQSTAQVLIGVGVSAAIYGTVSLLTKPQYEKADRFIKMAGGKTE